MMNTYVKLKNILVYKLEFHIFFEPVFYLTLNK